MTLITVAGVIVGAGILFTLFQVMVWTSPEWSERAGRRRLAHAQSLRDMYALMRLARQTYFKTYRQLNEELEQVLY